MKLNKLKALQLLITAFVSFMMIYSMVFVKEYYPFAPYTMYSYPHNINGFFFYDLYCEVNDRRIPIVNEMIAPMDEAKVRTNIATDYLEVKDFDKIRFKLSDLKELIKRNNFACDDVLLNVVTYESIQHLLDRKPIIQKTFKVGL